MCSIKDIKGDLGRQGRRQFIKVAAIVSVASLFDTHLVSAEGIVKQGVDHHHIVCAGGALTEIVYALNAQNDLVGVDTTSLYPKAATKLPSVGYVRSLSAEVVLSLAPSLVLAIEDVGPPTVLRQIKEAGVPVVIVPSHNRFDGVLHRIDRIGDLLQKKDRSMALIKDLKVSWGKLQKKMQMQRERKNDKPISVLVVLSFSTGQMLVGGRNTSVDAMLHYAGAVNAACGFSGFKIMEAEAVIAANPDVILYTDEGLKAAGGLSGVLKIPSISKTIAGKHHRIVSQEVMLMLGFGPRFVTAVDSFHSVLEQAMEVC